MAIQFNWTSKTITLTSGTTSLNVLDVWSRWVDWVSTNDNWKFLPAFKQVWWDDIDITAGTSIPIYAFLLNWWKIKPQEANHTLNVSNGILLVDWWWDPFINTTWNYTVRINYSQPVQAITITTSTWWSGGWWLSIEEHNKLMSTVDFNDLIIAKEV